MAICDGKPRIMSEGGHHLASWSPSEEVTAHPHVGEMTIRTSSWLSPLRVHVATSEVPSFSSRYGKDSLATCLLQGSTKGHYSHTASLPSSFLPSDRLRLASLIPASILSAILSPHRTSSVPKHQKFLAPGEERSKCRSLCVSLAVAMPAHPKVPLAT